MAAYIGRNQLMMDDPTMFAPTVDPTQADPRAAALWASANQLLSPEVVPIWNQDNPVGTEMLHPQTVGMPQPTTYAGPAGQFINPQTGQLTEQGQARLDNPALNFDTGGIGGAIRSYHGSPHLFDAFDSGKIGTGEGAQAYGHGLYTAENEGVARTYRDDLGPQSDPAVIAAGNEFNAAHAAFDGSAAARARVDAAERALQVAEQNAPPGHMYEVDIHADPAHFLDWDKPLSEQHPVVRDALVKHGVTGPLEPTDGMELSGGAKLRIENDPDFGPRYYMVNPSGSSFRLTASDLGNLIGGPGQDLTGRGAHALLSTKLGGDAAASQALQQAGIPGIRYLDAGSRGAGQGSYNNVVFDAKNIEILRRYGIAGLLAGGAAAGATRGNNEVQ